MNIALFLLLLFPVYSYAEGLYLDLGASYLQPHTSYETDKSKTPIMGIVEAGYTYNSFTVFLNHTSSITDNYDNGMNTAGIKYRPFGN